MADRILRSQGWHRLRIALVAVLGTASLLAAQDDGDLDPRWGSGGIARIAAPAATSPTAIGCAPDASCYVSYNTNGSDFGVHRITPTGAFSGASSAAFDLGGGNIDMPNALAVGSDGKPVLAGMVSDGTSEWQVAVARFSAALATGLDGTFSGDGKVTQNFTGNAVATAVAVGPSGETVVAGCYAAGGNAGYDIAILRLLPNGTPDGGFDGNGVRTIDFAQNTTGPSDDCAYAVAIQPDGRIVAAGSARYGATDTDFAIVRLNLNGSLDATFSPGGSVGDGMATVAFDLSADDTDEATAVAIDRFGRIVLAGFADTGSNSQPALARLSASGSLDPQFDTDGKYVSPDTGEAVGVLVLPPPSERILFATTMGSLSALTGDGDPDLGFGVGGSILVDDPGATSTSPPLGMTSLGGMPVVVGTCTTPGQSYFAARYWMDQIFGDDFESGNTNGWRGW